MLEGLKFMHGKGVIHRDIKGGNILISREGVVKFCDFGLARDFNPQQGSYNFGENTEGTKKLNLTPRVVTRWYRSPELLLDDTHYTTAIDIWSVGCVFVELLTEGRSPFSGDDEAQTFGLIAQRCDFPTKIEWKRLSNLPNYRAYSKYIQTNPNDQSVSHHKLDELRSASKLEDFIKKYSYLW
jgi:serine/threonine protein kinase